MATETLSLANGQRSTFPEIGPGLGGLLEGLMQRAKPNMTPADWERVAVLSDDAHRMTLCASTLCSALGSMVMNDAMSAAGERVGSFEDGATVARLLWLLGDVNELAAQTMELATQADNWLMMAAGEPLHRRDGGKQ